MSAHRPVLPAYAASFMMGVRQALTSRAELVTRLVVYGTLLVMFHAVYAVMPLEELHVPGLTKGQMLWYFALTECLIVANPGLADFGNVIAEGRLTAMMQRPCGVFALFLSRHLGQHLMQAVLMLGVAGLTLPLLAGAPIPFSVLHFLLLGLFLVGGALLLGLLTCITGTVEVLGPYSRPANWIASKLVFVCGGLFFPVSFFPPLAQTVVYLTPFPAMVFVPASLSLRPEAAALWQGAVAQLFWLAALTGVAWAAERRMLRYVMERGD